MVWPFSIRKARPAALKRLTPTVLARLEVLEDRTVPAGYFLTGVGSATNPAEPFARLYDTTVAGSTSNVVGPGNINAFPAPGGSVFDGSVRVASGDVNGDGVDDVICAQGPGTASGAFVRIYDGASALFGNTASLIAHFSAYSNGPGASQNPGFVGGVFVAAADFNGDGFDELVTSAGAGARGHVKVFDFNGGGGTFLGSSPVLRSSFFAYTDFGGEIRVTTLTRQLLGGSVSYLVTSSGAGTTQCDVRLYQNPQDIGEVADGVFVPPFLQFFPFPGYTGGVSVAAGDADAAGDDELFVSKNDGISNVRVFNIASIVASGTTTPSPQVEFQAFTGYLGEVRLGAADVDGDGRVEVLTSTGGSPGAAGSHIKAWAALPTGMWVGTYVPVELRSFFAYQGYVGGVWLSGNDFTFTQTFAGIGTPLAIPDNSAPGVSSMVLADIKALNPATFTRAKAIRVNLNISHTWNGDLDVSLSHGSILSLFTDVNSNGDGFNVTLDDAATTAIDAPAASVGTPLTGTFRPEAPASLLGTFNGAALAFTWVLNVADDAAGDTGTLNSWSLELVL